MKNWIRMAPGPGEEIFLLPPLAERKGAARLRELAQLIGGEAARRAAGQAGRYLLEDSLVKEARLEGLLLPEDGEIRALSPGRWGESRELPLGARVEGLLLTDGQQRAMESLYRGRRGPDSARELLEAAERFFYEDSLKVVIRYTGPRLSPS